MKPERAKVFKETYDTYVKEIHSLDYLAKAEALGASVENNCLSLEVLGERYLFGKEGLLGPQKEDVSPAVQVIICKYILTTPTQLPELSSQLAAYREFADAAPLLSYFANNVQKTIEEGFSGKLDRLRQCGLALGGEVLKDSNHDLSLLFYPFPRVTLLLNFNDQDELFPASCSVVFQQSVEVFLDMECLAMTAALFAERLVLER